MALIASAPFVDGVVPNTLPAVGANGGLVSPPYGSSPIPGHLEIAPAPDGSLALQSTLQYGVPMTNAGYRAEVGWLSEGQGQERWYAVDVWIPSTINDADAISIMQLHDQYDDVTDPLYGTGQEKFVQIAAMLQSRVMYWWMPRRDRTTGALDDTTPMGCIAAAVPCVFDRWSRMVVHAKWVTTNAGWIEAWYDGIRVCSEWSKPSAYNDPTGPLMRFGMYSGKTPPLTTLRAWYRNARIYNGVGDTQLSVLGAAERAPVQALMVSG